MTFDARGGKKSSGGNTLVFGAITLTVVAGAFLAVLNLPKPDAGNRLTLAQIEAAVTIEAQYAAFSGQSARNFLTTLDRVDPDAYASLDRRLAKTDPYDHI
jgi:hypothetical protein